MTPHDSPCTHRGQHIPAAPPPDFTPDLVAYRWLLRRLFGDDPTPPPPPSAPPTPPAAARLPSPSTETEAA